MTSADELRIEAENNRQHVVPESVRERAERPGTPRGLHGPLRLEVELVRPRTLAKGEAGDAFARAQAGRYTKRPAVELYDLQTDPWELTNVAAKPENANTVARLRGQLDAWMKQQGDTRPVLGKPLLQGEPVTLIDKPAKKASK